MPRGGFNLIVAVSILVGTIVGAGIFALPYTISKSGILPGFFYFLILGIAVLSIHFFYAEIILRTKDGYGLVGVAKKYLGGWGRFFIIASVITASVGALLAYLILIGDFLKVLFSPLVSAPPYYFAVFFLVFSALLVFRGIKMIAPLELFSNFLFFLAIFLIFLFSLPQLNFNNFTILNSSKDIFLPYGVILFSLIGWSALPEVSYILKTPEEKRNIKKVIVVSSLVVVIFYFLFILSVVGVAGPDVSPDTVSGLIPHLDSRIILLVVLAGAITLADSFLVLALYLRNTLIFNFKFSKVSASFVVLLLPLILYLAGMRSFITVIGFSGTIIGVIQGIIIVLIFNRAKTAGDRMPEFSIKVPTFIYYFLIIVFLAGAIIQIFLM